MPIYSRKEDTLNGVHYVPVVAIKTAADDKHIYKVCDANGNLVWHENAVSRLIDFENATHNAILGTPSSLNCYSGRVKCNVADDGTINAYYGDPTYTEDGSNGQVMVKQPKFYYRVNPLKLETRTDGGLGYHMARMVFSVSDQQLPGYKLHPAFINESGDEVPYILIGAYEGSSYDTSDSEYIKYDTRRTLQGDAYSVDFNNDKLCSIADVKPVSGLVFDLTRANAEKLANNRGTGWHIETIKATAATQILFMIEYGANSQVNLASGVSGISDNVSYNCSSLTGSTASHGNGSGRATSTVNEKGGVLTTYTDPTTTSCIYRGEENPWGNMWTWINGVNIWGNGTMLGGVPYICDDFTFAEDTNTGKYKSAGFSVVNANNYVCALGYSTSDYDWLLMGSKNKSSDNNGIIGDYTYITQNLAAFRVARLGGFWCDGTNAGLFNWSLDSPTSNRFRGIGARLCYYPQT